jgi:NAD(P)-dependent dehydrogenase (short-subunit alcohol dehydrogenase family)
MNLTNRIKFALSVLKNGIPPSQIATPISDPEPSLVMDNRLLFGKNVLITGAGRNIGKSIAVEMGKQGANIFFTDIDPKSRDLLEAELKSYEIDCQGFVSDISQTEDSDRLLEELAQRKVIIDTLINNVGLQFDTRKITDLDLSQWHQTFNTNIFGPLYLTKNIAKMMLENSCRGSIIFITSIHQWITIGCPSYSSSKAALGMIIKELAVDLASALSGVRGRM